MTEHTGLAAIEKRPPIKPKPFELVVGQGTKPIHSMDEAFRLAAEGADPNDFAPVLFDRPLVLKVSEPTGYSGFASDKLGPSIAVSVDQGDETIWFRGNDRHSLGLRTSERSLGKSHDYRNNFRSYTWSSAKPEKFDLEQLSLLFREAPHLVSEFNEKMRNLYEQHGTGLELRRRLETILRSLAPNKNLISHTRRGLTFTDHQDTAPSHRGARHTSPDAGQKPYSKQIAEMNEGNSLDQRFAVDDEGKLWFIGESGNLVPVGRVKPKDPDKPSKITIYDPVVIQSEDGTYKPVIKTYYLPDFTNQTLRNNYGRNDDFKLSSEEFKAYVQELSALFKQYKSGELAAIDIPYIDPTSIEFKDTRIVKPGDVIPYPMTVHTSETFGNAANNPYPEGAKKLGYEVLTLNRPPHSRLPSVDYIRPPRAGNDDEMRRYLSLMLTSNTDYRDSLKSFGITVSTYTVENDTLTILVDLDSAKRTRINYRLNEAMNIRISQIQRMLGIPHCQIVDQNGNPV